MIGVALSALLWPAARESLEQRYARNPVDITGVRLPRSFVGATDAVLIFHGRGGEDRETDELREVAPPMAARRLTPSPTHLTRPSTITSQREAEYLLPLAPQRFLAQDAAAGLIGRPVEVFDWRRWIVDVDRISFAAQVPHPAGQACLAWPVCYVPCLPGWTGGV